MVSLKAILPKYFRVCILVEKQIYMSGAFCAKKTADGCGKAEADSKEDGKEKTGHGNQLRVFKFDTMRTICF